MKRTVALLLLAGGLVSCRTEQVPLSADHHLAARTAGKELTIGKLDSLFGLGTPPRRPSMTEAISAATMWLDFHRLAASAAMNDTMPSAMDAPLKLVVDEMKISKFLDGLSRRPASDTATEALYEAAAHGLIAARHIFLAFPEGFTPAQHDSVIKAAIALRSQLRAETFATAVRHFAGDGPSKSHAGVLGVVDSTQVNTGLFHMIRKMGYDTVSMPVVVPDGVEIVQRMSWNDARDQFVPLYRIAASRAVAAHIADVAMDRADVRVEKNAVSLLREALTDRDAADRDSTQLANYNAGEFIFTVRDFMDWIDVAALDQGRFRTPGPETRGDERMAVFLDIMIEHKILLRSADSAQTIVSAAERDSVKRDLTADLRRIWASIGLSPDSMRMRAIDDGKRDVLAHEQADRVLRDELNGKSRATLIPPLLHRALDAKFEGRISVFAIQYWLQVM